MAGREPEEKVARPVARQRWRAMTFLHWSYHPDQLRPLVDDELDFDTHDGRAWVGLTPFLMADFRAGCLPPVPGLSTFPETNLRTYVRGPDGKDGLWFLSLDADSLPTVLGASAGYWVPYRWSAMSVREDETVSYRSRRRLASAAAHQITVRPRRPLASEELSYFDHWLTGRWRAYTRIAGRLAVAPVQHEPWPLWEAEVEELEESVLAAAGLPKPEGEALVHYSPGVDGVRLGAPHFL